MLPGSQVSQGPRASRWQRSQVSCPPGLSGRCSPPRPGRTWHPSPDASSTGQPGAKVPAVPGGGSPWQAPEQLARRSEHELRGGLGCPLESLSWVVVLAAGALGRHCQTALRETEAVPKVPFELKTISRQARGCFITWQWGAAPGRGEGTAVQAPSTWEGALTSARGRSRAVHHPSQTHRGFRTRPRKARHAVHPTLPNPAGNSWLLRRVCSAEGLS